MTKRAIQAQQQLQKKSPAATKEKTKSKARFKCCLVVPHYNHLESFEAFLPKLRKLNMRCIVVDDGSNKLVKVGLRKLLENEKRISLYEHDSNRGKGAAMWTGAHAARARGYTHMLQIDADGQHDVGDVPRFLAMSKDNPEAIISGAPIFDESAPKARVYGRKVTDLFVAIETFTLNIRDSLCGYRIYPLKQFEKVFDKYHIGKRMDFDTDVMVKSVWEGIEVGFIETQVVYLENSASHFNYLEDNLRLIWLHTRLLLGTAVRLPIWAYRNIKALIKEYQDSKVDTPGHR